MTTPSATFEFSTDGGATWKASDLPLAGANALAASGSPIVVKARLSSLAGVGTVAWTVVTGDDQTIEAGALPQPVVASDKSCTLTIPGTGGRAYVLEALVNGGRLNSRAQNEAPGLRRRLAIRVKTANSFEVVAAAEADEASRTYGWIKAPNDVARAAGTGGGGGGASAATNAPPAVSVASAVGVATPYAREDHTHAGVTSVNGSQGAVVLSVPTAGGAPPTVAALSAAGTAPTFARSDHTHGGVASVNGSTGAVTVATPPVPGGAGDKDKIVVANGTGAALVLADTVWPVAGRYGSAGSTANDVFGTATVQSTGDATNGEALGVRANATAGKGRLAFYSSAEAAAGFLGYDETNDRLELGTSGKAWRVSSNAAGTTLPIVGEANNENVGLAGATAFASMVDGVAIGAGTTAPTTNTGTFAALFNSAGTFRFYAAQTFSFFPGGTTERFRVTTSETGFATTNVALYQIGGSYGGGVNVLWARNATTNPTTNPTNGAIFYVSGGEPLFRTSGGAIRGVVTIGAPVASGLYVASTPGGSPTRELKKRQVDVSDGTSFELIDFAA